jgi:hypothetical protein
MGASALAKTAIHEIQAYLLYLIAAVLFVGAAIVDAIVNSQAKLDEAQKRELEAFGEYVNRQKK